MGGRGQYGLDAGADDRRSVVWISSPDRRRIAQFFRAIALIIAFVARKIARRPADAGMSFGYGRVEVVAALVNFTTLVELTLYLAYEGVLRMLDPKPIDGWMVVWVATLALVVDLVTAALTYRMSKESMNTRAAFLHNAADALGSVAVIVAGTLVILKGWVWVDPAVTLMISGYILWHVKAEIGGVLRVLMLGSPPGLDGEEVARAMENVDGVVQVHHVHLWAMQEHAAAINAHLVIVVGRWGQADAIKAEVKRELQAGFNIGHSTLELECAHHACGDTVRMGHGDDER